MFIYPTVGTVTIHWAARLFDDHLVLFFIYNKLLVFVSFKLVKIMLCRKKGQKKFLRNLQHPLNIPKWERSAAL